MKPAVLLLTSLYDFAADSVAVLLQERGVEYVRVNREDVANYRIAIDPVKPDMSIRFDGKTATADALRSVWFRQPVFLRNTPARALSCEEQLARSQWSAFWRTISVFEGVQWMNWPQATYLAECKPYQLLCARRCGFAVPDTLAGNDAAAIKARFQNGRFVVKSLDTVLLHEGDDCLFAYTNEGNSEQISDDNIHQAPLIAQEYAGPKTDIRVTVVGERLWAVEILSGGAPVEVDWRTEKKDDLEYIDHELPAPVKGRCLALMAKLGLNFGAIDLVLRGKEYYFIEINPTGEWAWLNTDNRGIDRAIAAWLAEGAS